ncbi:MAG: hypothetical protein KDD61_00425 [Bdellovibrionales bacterium]|nr:hypothetical protein [Bdellovibrionales bacterium]
MDRKRSPRIIVSGNSNEGLAFYLKQKVSGEFFSRSNGFDLTIPSNQKRFAQLSLDFDVFINCSSLEGFSQTLLLREVFHKWKEKGHKGYIINIGSTCVDRLNSTDNLYPIEKISLRDYSRNLSRTALGRQLGTPPSGIRVTHISPGAMQTEGAAHESLSKIDPAYVADLIVWLMQQPEGVNINEISLDAIQPPMVEASTHQSPYV